MPDLVEPLSPSRRARRRRRPRIVLVGLLLFAAWLTRWVYLHLTLRPTPRPEYWAEQIEKLDPPPPGAYSHDESVRILEKALVQATSLGVVHRNTWLGPPGESADWIACGDAFASEDFAKLRATLIQLGKRQWRLAEVRPGVGTTWWTSTSGLMIPCMQMLLDHGRWSWEQEKDLNAVLENWRTVARLAHNSGRSRCLVDRLYEHSLYHGLASAMAEWAAGTLGEHLSECEGLQEPARPASCPCGPVGARAWVLEIGRIMGPELPPTEYCAGERMALIATLEHVYVREGGDWLDIPEAARWAEVTDPYTQLASPASVPVPSRVWNVLSPVFSDFADAVDAVDACLAYPEAAVDLPAAKAVAAGENHPTLGPLQGLPHYLGYHVGSAIASMYAARCHFGAALTCLAIRDFRLSRGRLPSELGELVPDFLPRLPVDYGDRGTLRYRREGESFVLYSVGWNGVDDGGVSHHPEREFDESNPDIVFITYP